MKRVKVLLLEDAKDQKEIFVSSVEVFNHKNADERIIESIIASTVEEVRNVIDSSFDGAIFDLKINDDDEGGNKMTALLSESYFRIPVVFVTGYPDLVSDHPLIVNKRARGAGTYEDDLELIYSIKKTGLTDIMGGRGIIEQTLNTVFEKNLLPQIQAWITYGATDAENTQRALLRHTLNHLLQLLEDDSSKFFPEEAFISPPLVGTLKTGSIVTSKKDQKSFVVLNPACDLVVRKKGIKTDRILLVEIESSNVTVDAALTGLPNNDKKRAKLKDVFKNNYTDYFHWLPQTKPYFNDGGFLNFRKLLSVSEEDFSKDFNPPQVQISPPFVKDIVARFSSYYARQGQPDIDSDAFVSQALKT